jgi:hypothetical protein
MDAAHTTQPTDQPATLVTLTILTQVEALGTPRGEKLSPGTRQALGTIETMGFPWDGLNDTLFRLLAFCPQESRPAAFELALRALTEEGFAPTATPTTLDVLLALDAVRACHPWNTDTYRARAAYGAAVALAAGQPYVALTILDGPEGAGIGWGDARNDLLADLGQAPELDQMTLREIPN